ncbi:MAG: PqqD family protein [Gammaproteobacteria bacterium]|nr:PqqD family protein [Gammaproteobacteria bacterium]
MNDIIPVQNENTLAQRVGDEFILLDNVTHQVHQLNVTASFIWEKCNGERSSNEIATALTEMFEIQMDQALTDVKTVLGELHGKSLLVIK